MFEERRRLLISMVLSDNFSDGLTDADGKYIFDNLNALIVCFDGAYQSSYTAAQIDSFITTVLGGAS